MILLYCNFGSCNEGDHTASLEEYATLEEAVKEMDRLRELYPYDTEHGGLAIIQGEIVRGVK